MAKHFVLVHEACHGSWCWYQVEERLQRHGHRVDVIRLADAQSCRSILDYFDPLISFIDNLPPDEKVILVGHGRGGLAVSVATENDHQHVSVGVYVAALTPGPSFNILDINGVYNPSPDFYMDSNINYDTSGKITSIVFGQTFLQQKVYQLSPQGASQDAINLRRPYPYFDDERSADALTLTPDKYGAVPRVYIKCPNDIMIPPDVQETMIHRNPPGEQMTIPNSDHMPMASRPEELAHQLRLIAQKY